MRLQIRFSADETYYVSRNWKLPSYAPTRRYPTSKMVDSSKHINSRPDPVVAFFGIFQTGLDPIEPAVLAPVKQFIDSYLAAPSALWQEGPVALGQSLPPLTIPAGGLAITGMTRLDNRNELASLLRISAHELAALPDEALVLKAYEKWGDHCPERLLGDFAFAIWDAPNRQLFCARDHMGIKPFYFAFDQKQFIFASDPQAVAAHPEVPNTVSHLAVARYLGEGDLHDERLTFQQAVHKLPTATALTVDASGLHECRYWSPEDATAIRLPSEQDYIEQLRELLVMAVADRLPTAGPVGAHLSGGIDSSGIVAIAADQLGPRSGDLHTWSWMRPPRSSEERAHPEWQLGQQVADEVGARHHHTPFDSAMLLDVLRQDLLRANDTVDLWYEFAVRPAAAASTVNVILSGWGGDQLISYDGYNRHAETFWRGQVVSTLQDLYEESAYAPVPARRFLGMCYRDVLQPVLPARLNGRWRNARRVRRNYLDCADRDFENWAASQQRAFNPYLGNRARVDQLRHMQQLHMNARLESWAVSGARAGVDYRYPLLDKRIVEFALGLPPQMYRSHGMNRYIYRAATEHWLPPEITRANTKAEPVRVTELYHLARRAARDWRQTGPPQSSPFISGARLTRQIQSLPDARDGLRDSDAARLMAVLKAILVLNL